MSLRGTDPGWYITEYTLVYEYKKLTCDLRRKSTVGVKSSLGGVTVRGVLEDP
jgi:hypothetical protein